MCRGLIPDPAPRCARCSPTCPGGNPAARRAAHAQHCCARPRCCARLRCYACISVRTRPMLHTPDARMCSCCTAKSMRMPDARLLSMAPPFALRCSRALLSRPSCARQYCSLNAIDRCAHSTGNRSVRMNAHSRATQHNRLHDGWLQAK